mgnify:CR=1 FL=1
MARPITLGPTAQRLIGQAVDLLFDRLKARFLGPGAEKLYGKQLVFRFPAALSLTGLFETASRLEGVRPRDEVLRALLRVSGSYLDAQRERTKAQVAQRVSAFLTDAQRAGVKTDVETVLGGQLSQVFGEVKRDVQKIVETETTIARNTSIFDAIGRVAATTGREDPTVFFVVVKDNSLCEECRGLHLLDDGVTPRVWKQSEVGGGYHKRGDDHPKIGGLHPHCRCVLTHLLPGYGFDAAGRIMYRGQGWDELAHQRT